MTANIHSDLQGAKKPQWVDDLRPSLRLWYLVLILPILAAMAFAIFQPIQVLPRFSPAPAYSLIDQNGNQVTSEDMRGSLVLYTFAHSRCTAPCIPTSATLASLQPALANVDLNGIPLRYVTIYVDPDEATPAVLKSIAKSLGADSDQWRLLTGDAVQLKNVIGLGFRTYFNQEADGSFTVDPVFALVDGWGILRATYRTASPDIDRLTRDLRLVVQEASNSTGVNRYAYEAAHLFMCYAK
jgi:protein SCO1/2